jgi:predicted O-methyltransferase YrrM
MMNLRYSQDWVEPYLATGSNIPGWFGEEDVRLFSIIDRLQADAGVRGDLLEVGGYLAKSAIALGYMRREEEALVVVDPWDTDISDTENAAEQGRLYPDVNLDTFRANFQKFHVSPPDMRRGISSVCLPALTSSNYRFIHVDGSHEWDQVKADVEQVLRLLGSHGVVAFDDMHAPGVGSAVWPACASGDLVPIASTGKLYATRTPDGVLSPEELSDAIRDVRGIVVEARHTIFGHTVLGVSVSSSPEDWGPPPLLGRAREFIPPVLLEAAKRSGLSAWVKRR